MHFLMALACIFVLLVAYGAPDGRLFDTRSADEVDRATPWVIGEVVEGSAADDAGLQPGDRIRAVDGREIVGFGELREVVGPDPGDEVTLAVERDGDDVPRPTRPIGSEGGDGRLGVLVDRQFTHHRLRVGRRPCPRPSRSSGRSPPSR